MLTNWSFDFSRSCLWCVDTVGKGQTGQGDPQGTSPSPQQKVCADPQQGWCSRSGLSCYCGQRAVDRDNKTTCKRSGMRRRIAWGCSCAVERAWFRDNCSFTIPKKSLFYPGSRKLCSLAVSGGVDRKKRGVTHVCLFFFSNNEKLLGHCIVLSTSGRAICDRWFLVPCFQMFYFARTMLQVDTLKRKSALFKVTRLLTEGVVDGRKDKASLMPRSFYAVSSDLDKMFKRVDKKRNKRWLDRAAINEDKASSTWSDSALCDEVSGEILARGDQDKNSENTATDGFNRQQVPNLWNSDDWHAYHTRLKELHHTVMDKKGWPNFSAVFMVSAKTGDGVPEVLVSCFGEAKQFVPRYLSLTQMWLEHAELRFTTLLRL